MRKGKNTLTRLTAIALLITMIALILISGTYAKYTTSKTATDTATVAKWQVKINNADATGAEALAFDLFSNTGVFDLDAVADVNDLSAEAGVVDTDVVNSGKKVAPGTWGKVGFALENNSDVTADYSVDVTALTTTLPLEFSTDGQNWTTATAITTALATAPHSLGTGTLAIGSTTPTTATATLYWRWVYENGTDATLVANDATDTGLGTTGTATCNITAGVVFTQVD